MSMKILKEFLVAVGFKVDDQSFKKSQANIAKFEKAIQSIGIAIDVVAAAVKVGVTDVEEQLEGLYYASQRIGSSAKNITAFGYAVSQMGGDAKAATASLENLAELIRKNPNVEALLNGMGVSTRNKDGGIRDRVMVMKDLARQFQGMDYRIASQRAGQLGIDTATLQAMRRGDLDKYFAQYEQMSRNVDMDDAASGAHEFMVQIRALGAQFKLLAMVIAKDWAPMVKVLVIGLKGLVDLLAALDKWTDGWSTRLVTLAAVVASVAAAVGAMLGGVEGVAAIFATLAAAIGAPIAIIVAAVAGLGIAAYELVKHWDVVGPFFKKTWDGLADMAESAASRIVAAWDRVKGSSVVAGAKAMVTAGSPANDNAGAAASSTPAAGLAGRIQQAVAYFRSQGWSQAQAVGIVANLLGENDTLDPNRREVLKGGKPGPGYGLAQWTDPSRVRAFSQWAGHSLQQSTFAEQLGFLQQELMTTEYRNAGGVRSATTAAEAASAMVATERPKNPADAMRRRADIANQLVGGTFPGLRGSGVNLNANTTVIVQGANDPSATGRAVGAEQDRVNSNTVRQLKGAAF